MGSIKVTRRGLLRTGAVSAASTPLWGSQVALGNAAFGASPANITTNVAILGGGAAGLHTAYQLTKLPLSNPDSRVCLFEANSRLGGRIFDIALNPARPDLVFGVGAQRVMETQNYVFQLADDLGITLVAAPWQDDLISARGEFANNSEDMRAAAYPLVSGSEGELYDELRFGPLRADVADFPDFRSYVREAVGTQGYHFLTEMFRFRADFQANLDARGYLDYLDEEWDVCCTPFYPVGGMSEFIKRLAANARQAGARIFTGEPALQISKVSDAYPYLIRTPKYSVRAKKLVIGVDAYGFSSVGGPLAEAIKSSAQFKDLIGIKVVTVAQRWPRAWWLDLDSSIRRAWTTEHALDALEIPISPYVADQLVTRTVYDDDMRTVEFWERTARLGIGHVEDEIMRGLTYLFPGVTIPQPLKTVLEVWPAGWYWLRGGSRFTNANIASWAVEPLRGERISLVGEAYNPQRSGWSDGAYKSSINTLNAKFGMSIAIPAAAPAAIQRSCGDKSCRVHARA